MLVLSALAQSSNDGRPSPYEGGAPAARPAANVAAGVRSKAEAGAVELDQSDLRNLPEQTDDLVDTLRGTPHGQPILYA
jgi:hypothetical protein